MSKTPRISFVPAALIGSSLCAALIFGSTTGTISGFVASVTNSNNSASLGTLVMQEQNGAGSITCNSTDGANNSYTCATINKYGGAVLAPGGASSTTVTIKNIGSLPASGFSLAPQPCSQSGSGSASDLCSKLQVAVTQTVAGSTSTTSATKTLTAFATAGPVTLASVPAGSTVSFTFTVTAPNLDNTYQGLQASQPMIWTFNS